MRCESLLAVCSQAIKLSSLGLREGEGYLNRASFSDSKMGCTKLSIYAYLEGDTKMFVNFIKYVH